MKKHLYLPLLILLLGAGCQQFSPNDTVPAPAVEESQTPDVPEIKKQADSTVPKNDTAVDTEDTKTTLYRAPWFGISYPSSFTARPTEPTTQYNENTYIQTDEAYFTSSDNAVEFFVYSPLWSGNPKTYLTIAQTETMVSEDTKETLASDANEQYGDSITRWVTVKANDGSYHRSFVSIKEQVGTGSELHRVFGIKYTNEAAYNTYKAAYMAFKESLAQYADGGTPQKTQKTSERDNDVRTYTHPEQRVSFDYPSHWNVKKDEVDVITITSPQSSETNSQVLITIPVQSFESYEQQYNTRIQEGKMSVSTKHPTGSKTQKAKKYGQHGWLLYIVEVDDGYVGIGSERSLNDNQKAGLDIILNSMSL